MGSGGGLVATGGHLLGKSHLSVFRAAEFPVFRVHGYLQLYLFLVVVMEELMGQKRNLGDEIGMEWNLYLMRFRDSFFGPFMHKYLQSIMH